MRLAALSLSCLLIGALPASAGQRARLIPDDIDGPSVTCNIQAVVEAEAGDKGGTSYWHADAVGKHKDGKDWRRTVGKFDATRKGRHKAEKVCSKLADEAEDLFQKGRK